MIFRRGGATTSLVLGIAGVLGVGVAGGMALTGTSPCSILQACGVKPATPVAQTVALQSGESCPVTGASMAGAAKESSCCDVINKGATPATPAAQTVALAADCSKELGCEKDDGVTCSKDTACHKAAEVKATPVAMTGEVCAMAASCVPSKCTTEMVKACTDSGKICPLGEAKVVPASMTGAAAECSKEPGCENDDNKTCSKNTECHKATEVKATPVAMNAEKASCCSTAKATPVALNAAASTCSDAAKATCASTTAAASTCSSASAGKVIAVASAPAASCGTPMPIGTLRTLAYSGKGMPMVIPAAFANVQSVETKAAGCGGCGTKATTPVAQPVALKADCSKEPGCEKDDGKTCSKDTECHKAVASR